MPGPEPMMRAAGRSSRHETRPRRASEGVCGSVHREEPGRCSAATTGSKEARPAAYLVHPRTQVFKFRQLGNEIEYLWRENNSSRMARKNKPKGTRDVGKKQQDKRIRKRVHITLSDEVLSILKNTGYPASRVIEKLILNTYSETHPICLQLGISRCACCNAYGRTPPCGGNPSPQLKTDRNLSAAPRTQTKKELLPEAPLPQETLNDVWEQHKGPWRAWLNNRVKGKRLSDRSAKDYFTGVRTLFETYCIGKPSACDAIAFGDKQSRGLRNFFNYLEDEEITYLAGYSLENWRRKVRITASGKDRVFPETEDIIEAYMHLPDEVVTEFKLLVYTGCRFSHGYEVLKNIHRLKIEIAENIAYINTEPLTKHTKQTFAMFFPASFIEELQDFSPDTMQHPSTIIRKIQHGNVSVKTIRKWHFNVLRKKARMDSAIANFMHGRGQSNVGDDVYLEQIGFAIEEYPKVLPFIPNFN
mgnify:FL=1